MSHAEKFCQYVLEIPVSEFYIVGRDKERGVGQIKVTRWPLEIGLSNYRQPQISISHVPSGGMRPSDNLDSETFVVPPNFERQISDMIKLVCGMQQEQNLERLWKSLSSS